MEGESRGKLLLKCLLFAVLLNQVFCRSIEEFADQKNYYSPDPNTGSPPPKHSHKTPSCPPPPYSGSACTPCGGTPSTPSHGGSSGTHSPPSHGGGGGYYNTPPIIPIVNPPPSPTVTPISPITPTPTTPLFPPTPIDPTISAPPLTPTDPTISTPSAPPFIPDPNIPPFFPGTCNYWNTHPAAIWGIFGYWATIGQFFGAGTALPFGGNLSVRDALANTRNDGIGALYREGTASLLNSLVSKKFPLTTEQVRDAFASAVGSEKSATVQARLFKLANEGKLKKN